MEGITLGDVKNSLFRIQSKMKSCIRIHANEERHTLILNMQNSINDLMLYYKDQTKVRLSDLKEESNERATMSLERKFYVYAPTFEYQVATCIECIKDDLTTGDKLEILYRVRSIFELHQKLMTVFEKKKRSRPVGRGRKGQVWDPELKDWRSL